VIKQTITCDMCGREKGEVNHWYLMGSLTTFVVTAWASNFEGYQHICGQECAHKALDKFFAGITEQKP
jgi:hypothetical protein